jgi:hypothetical protein
VGFNEVGFFDLGLASRRVLCRSDIGEPTHRRWFHGMPRIHPQLQDCVFFLFGRNPETGKVEGPLGTGFLVSRPISSQPRTHYIYAVTNWHVAVRLGASIIRLNTENGETRPLEYDPADWVFDADEDSRRLNGRLSPLPSGDTRCLRREGQPWRDRKDLQRNQPRQGCRHPIFPGSGSSCKP